MIHFFYLINRLGRIRVAKYYVPYEDEEKRSLESQTLRMITKRPKDFTHFIEYKSMKLIFRRYAGLYFIVGVDYNDNELAYLEVIHLFVECLDDYFGTVCELDVVYTFYKAYAIIDEIFLGGEIQETSRSVVVSRLRDLDMED
ncbi:Adaptor protein complex 2 (AP-2), sigma subunitB [Monocercomonoides exilis]|uniref:Adaptor protein complex 2 (AP-2), sigma subunitA n=1 Tax=Monocercomonoides exilis TaxID=2049356 RepID=UPI00355AC955|nr:Adaptor protein complex 2 (AP-2), sigma subunitA [Monocercomonoides exilis]KAH7831406.1 Adaptor protein complex 2 (AP-2), sigma subunitB [Monocercomonoides exilis]|eukprot:MONOS_7391.1-p1 / transcript=MONOS_7391.1 / gene=MONOS_7391 / organism=Monocercomonoides_exilis_PA203 / gene_product= Adaptor protein complex 2 (AP-2), sigma subunit A / transcript_product= Adaptor protein complex 2 (AP-2), sigma subunit A / location=Mono_scaffold00251:39485-40035(-) / protein_length=143 / sequence_SO=supercontig / SO=protein_coding / is_pseudo=false